MEPKHDMPQFDESHERAPRHVDVAVIPDIDRTLLRSDALVDLVCSMLEGHGVSKETIVQEKAYIKSHKGKEFPTMDYLRDRYGDTTVDAIQKDILELISEGVITANHLLYEGALELLDYLEKSRYPFGAITFGAKRVQEFKIAVIHQITKTRRHDAQFPAKPTENRKKAEALFDEKVLHSYGDFHYVPAGFMTSEALLAKDLIILDDKESNLSSPDPSILGIHINNDSPTGKQYSLRMVVERLKQGKTLRELSEWYKPEGL